MARARNPDRDKAFEIYKKHGGKIELVQIAEMLNRPPGTIRGWKNKDNWEERLSGTFQKNAERSRTTKKDKGNNQKQKEKVTKKIIKEVAANEKLTDKQQLFCIYYLKYYNATKAYQKAYGCDYLTANANGPRLLVNASIKQQIEKLKSERMEGIYLDGKDILQKYIDIAFADITDYASFGQEEVVVDIDDEGEPIKRKINVVKLKDSDEIDGTIVTEVSKGRDGVKIKLADKMKALEKLEKYFDILPDNHKRRLEEEKLKLEREKFEFIKRKEEGDEDALEKLDRLIEAIDNEAKR